jgi:glucose-6-phosphate 1-dehydrogenase
MICGQSLRRGTRQMDKHADALVFFGITGDLAYKKIFPALHSMIRRGKFARTHHRRGTR